MIFESLSSIYKKQTGTLSEQKKMPQQTDLKLGRESKKEELQEPEIYGRARIQFGYLYNEFKDPKERMSKIMERIESFFRYIDKNVLSVEKINETRQALQACTDISDRESFLDAVIESLRSVLDIMAVHPDKFEEAQAKSMDEAGGFTEINRLLSYGKSGEVIHIHARAGKTVGKKITLYREGFKRLADIVNNDPEIEVITATSTLVAEYPGLFTRAGFSIEDVSDEIREQHFGDEERKIKMATIGREGFLKIFLKKD